MVKKSLAETHPDIARQWHPTKNGNLKPSDVTWGSQKKVWWKCNKGEDHEWENSISKRTAGRGCTICSGRKIVKSNCLATTHPVISKQWHPSRNGDLSPLKITSSSSKKVWWKCDKGEDHEWFTSVNNRKLNTAKIVGCPICSNQKVVKSNCLATTHPELAKEWHPSKNGNLTPKKIVAKSSKKVWWKCNKGEGHEWIAAPNTRNGVQKRGCPFCAKEKVVLSNSIVLTHPEIAKEWHPSKNGTLSPYYFSYGSNKKVWWKCDKGESHEWKTKIIYRTSRNFSCPFCANRKVDASNSLATTHPELAKEWHPTKNGTLSPNNFSYGSDKKVWWKCDKGEDHEWKSTIYNRSSRDCPVCSNKKVVLSNSLATTHPELAKQWHPTKNGDSTPYIITSGSNKKVWWKCDKVEGHEWRTSPVKREGGTKCPFCTLTPQSKQELIITFELMKLFKNIDPKGFKTHLEGRLRAIDIFIPSLNLCIEFDGSYWHKGKRELDKIKSEMLLQEGFKLIRVREEPLKRIYETDIISKKPYNGKHITDGILSVILANFKLDEKLINKIKEYQSQDQLQNEKGLERYIDKILTKKAGKR